MEKSVEDFEEKNKLISSNYESTKNSINYKAAFEAMPGIGALIMTDAPKYTILAVTDEFVDTISTNKKDLIGKGHLEFFPENSKTPGFTHVSNIRASYDYVIAYKKRHEIPAYQYGISKIDGTYTHLSAHNFPVLDEKGNVIYIVHTAAEVTSQVRPQQKEESLQGMQQMQNLFMKAPVAISILKGTDLIIELASESTLKLWGRGKEAIGKSLVEIIPEVKGQGYIELINGVMETGMANEVYERPVTLLKNGKEEILYLNYFFQPYFEKDKTKPAGVLAVCNDVTERVITRNELVKKEQSLKESAEKFKTLLEAIPQMTWTNLPTGDVNFYNSQWYSYTGLNYEQTKDWGWKTVIHPDDVERTVKDYTAALQTGNIFETENRYKRFDGEYRWYLNRALPVKNDKGEVFLWVGSATDIHDRKRAEKVLNDSERSLRSIILQAPVAMCIFRGKELVIEIANNSMFEFWGKPSHEVMQKPLFEALPEAKNQGYEELMAAVLGTGQSFSANELPVILPRGEEPKTVFINFTYEPLREADGSISGILAMASDVTQQVLARQKIEEVVSQRTKELAEANDRLQLSNIELDQFAYAASHDLQEPLRKIKTFMQMIKADLGETPDRVKQYINKIESSTGRMQNLINDVLKFSQLSAEKEKFEITDLNNILGNILIDFELLVEQKSAKITIDALPVIEVNPLQMNQLFTNLISNALKFSSAERKPAITVSAKRLTRQEVEQHEELKKDDVYYLIEIKDNGIGFDQQYAQQIFIIFQRLHGKKDYAGTGIGLAMCRKIVASHHGVIYANAFEGIGASFTIILPEKQHELN